MSEECPLGAVLQIKLENEAFLALCPVFELILGLTKLGGADIPFTTLLGGSGVVGNNFKSIGHLIPFFDFFLIPKVFQQPVFLNSIKEYF